MDSVSPIVIGFLNHKEPFGIVLQKHCNANQALEAAFLALSKESTKKELSQDLLLDIDRAIMEGHPDPNLFLLFICLATDYFHKYRQIEKAQAILAIASSIAEQGVLRFIKAIYFNHLVIHKRIVGKINECKIYLEKCMSLIDKSEPQAGILIQNYMTGIAVSGQLKVNGEYQLDKLNGLPETILTKIALQVKIINCIITGNHVEGLALIENISNKDASNNYANFKTYTGLLKIASGDFDETNYAENEGKYMACAFHHFSNENYDEAMYFYTQLRNNPLILNMNLSFEYLPLHYHLCQKRSGAAKLLLQERAQKGHEFYLDDLFWGRIQLLENDEEAMNKSFSRLMQNVIQYDAIKRLEFELQFAREIKLPIILRLLNGWKPEAQKITQKKPPEKNQKTASPLKGISRLIGNSVAINQVKKLAIKYADLKAPILITGETGTGKELVSRALHEEGPYANEPFLAINCGALTENLLQSELFGYEAGSFTGALKQRKGIFEAAGKGTVFLDEFGEISPSVQVSFLRVLEANEIRMIGSTSTRKIECKIVIATNVDLRDAVIAKKFREDLFFRISRFEIKLPALRERKEDIPQLIQHFLAACSTEHETPKTVTPELLNSLVAYRWPGNIRKLKNEVERMYVLNPGKKTLDINDFDPSHLQEVEQTPPPTLQPKEPATPQPDTHITQQKSRAHDEAILNIINSGFRIDKRIELLKELFREHKKLTRNQIMKITNVGPTTATKDLKTLMADGFIVRRSPTKSSSTDYFEIQTK